MLDHLGINTFRILRALIVVAFCMTPIWAYTGKIIKPKAAYPQANSGVRTLNIAPIQMQQSVINVPSATGGIRRQAMLNARSLVLPVSGAAAKAASSSAAQQSEWDLWINEANSTPIFMQAKPSRGAAKRAAGVRSAELVMDFVEANAGLFKLRQPRLELAMQRMGIDVQGREHVVFEQRYQGVPIWGASLIGHVSGDQGLFAVNGRYQPTPTILQSVVPAVTAEQAIEGVFSVYGEEVQPFSEQMQQLLQYTGPHTELYIWSEDPGSEPHLTWKVEMRPNSFERWRYFVDAQTGEVLDKYQFSPSDGPTIGSGVDLYGQNVELNSYQSGSDFYLIDGSIATLDSGLSPVGNSNLRWTMFPADGNLNAFVNTSNVFDDPVAVSAHTNMAKVYDYFYNAHGRNGIDGLGGNMISAVHVLDEDGNSMPNAYWNGVFMAYGDGGEVFEPLAKSLDVAAHEMAHGIIEKTANLEYRFQSGALNESIADIFGAMVDNEDWLIGEDVVTPDFFPSGALRDLQDPHNGDSINGWQPAHMDEYVELPETEDQGGVHINSGIPNRAAFLMAEAIGRNRTAQIYYHVLTNYLTPTSQFIDCRLAAKQAAVDLFPDDAQVLDAVRNAFDGVGIVVPGNDGSVVEDPPTQTPGDRNFWVASVGASADGDNSLWLVKPGSDLATQHYSTQLTPTQVYAETGNAITAPQHGRFLLFIDSDNNLRFIGTDGEGEEVLNADGDWGSISVSPDGNKLAATTVYEDSTIFFFDLEHEDGNKPIKLYHTTTAADVVSYVSRYADALQWDATGQYIMYDSFNSLPGIDGETIDFWDIKIVDPISETITSWSPPLPPGVHLANPSFSGEIVDGKINDCRLLYEVVDENVSVTAIQVLDRCSGQAGQLLAFPDAIFTFPRFIDNDNEIVFEYWTLQDDIFTADLWRLPLSTDRLSGTVDSPTSFVREAQSPYAFTVEDESAVITAVEEEQIDVVPTHFSLVQNYPNPFNPETMIAFDLAVSSEVTLAVFDVSGQRISTLVNGFRSAGSHTVKWRGVNDHGDPVGTGIYFYQLSQVDQAGQHVSLSRKMLLLR